jgi:heme-degrading monooxygenase HmoA
MAYIFQVSFNIPKTDMSKLDIGGSIERTLGYLKTLLPSQPGFIDTRVLYSLDDEEKTYVVVVSEWNNWEDLENHRESSLSEDKVLEEFSPHTKPEDLIIRVYGEVA